MSREDPESRADRDLTGYAQAPRHAPCVTWSMQRVYDVPAEDVAASIIRDAIVVAAPAPAQRH